MVLGSLNFAAFKSIQTSLLWWELSELVFIKGLAEFINGREELIEKLAGEDGLHPNEWHDVNKTTRRWKHKITF
jgi:hypothetical protein